MSRVERMFGPRKSWGRGDEMAAVRERAVRQEGSAKGTENKGVGAGVPDSPTAGRRLPGTDSGLAPGGSSGTPTPTVEREAEGNGTQVVPYGMNGAKAVTGEKRAVKGFVSIKCPECGRVHNICLHEARTIFNCKNCGQPVALEGLKSIKMDCPRCHFKARYLTNRQEKLIQMECLNCSQPVNFRRGYRRGNYVVENREGL